MENGMKCYIVEGEPVYLKLLDSVRFVSPARNHSSHQIAARLARPAGSPLLPPSPVACSSFEERRTNGSVANSSKTLF